jgi:hypothetical protein
MDQPAVIPIRVECPPGACVCDRERLLGDPHGDKRILMLTREEEKRLVARITQIDTYDDLKKMQAKIRANLGAELVIEPGPNEVRTVRGLHIELRDMPGLCKKTRQAVPAAVRKCLESRLEIAYAILDAHDLFGPG